jgi:Zn-dependent protease with chaperone function
MSLPHDTGRRPHAFAAAETPAFSGPAAPALAPLANPGGAPEVDARRCVESGTSLALALSGTFALIGAVFLLTTITGAVIAGVLWLANLLTRRRAWRILRASSLRVGEDQLPEIHACVSAFSQRLGLAEAPEVYVVDAAEVNGFALRFGRRHGIVLTDETVAACLEGKSPGALAFVIAHELGHVALGHHRWWRTPLRSWHWLSRLDELSADGVACELVGSSEAAESGVLLLVVGPRLLSFVDRAAARAQAAEVARDRAVRRAERMLTHPVAMRRLDRVVQRFAGEERLRLVA